MTISFDNIPNNLRAPLFYIEVDNSMANNASEIQRTLLIGQMTDGTATPLIPVRVSSVSQVIGLFGQGSMLHTMMQKYLQNDGMAEIWILPFANDATEMQKATGKITVASAPTGTGIISLYISGTRIRLTVKKGMAVADIAADLTAKINENKDLPLIATAAEGVITLTAKNLGVAGNSIDLRLNYLGVAGGEETPDGLELTIEPMASGKGAPNLADGLINLQDREFDFIVNPYTDTASLNTMKDFLSDNGGRWGWDQQIYGHSFSVASGTYGELSAIGEVRNDQHGTIWGVHDSPHTTHDLAAAFVGAIAGALRNDPGRPTQTLQVSGVLPPPLQSRFTLAERNNLLYTGISTFTVTDDDTVQVENTITTYQKNKYGAADDSYLQVETLFLLMYVNRFMRREITSKFGRMKLAQNGTRFGAGQAIVTPNLIKAELVAQYKRLEFNGYVQNAKAFMQNVLVEIDSDNPNRINVLYPGTLINQLRIFAVRNQFRLN